MVKALGKHIREPRGSRQRYNGYIFAQEQQDARGKKRMDSIINPNYIGLILK